MGGILGGSTPKYKAPAVTVAPPPVIEDAQAKAEADTDVLRRRRGRASTILTEQSSMDENSNAATKALTGA